MSLSHDTPAQAQSALERNLETARAFDRAHTLAKKLMLFERNPEPMREREAPNPAHGIRIRRIVPMVPSGAGRVDVDQQCRDHNEYVSSLGASGSL